MQHLLEPEPAAIARNGSLSVAPYAPEKASFSSVARAGVNLAGAEFGAEMPGTCGVTYIYPTVEVLDYHRSQGRTLVRLPFRWERIQRALFAPLDADELSRLKECLHAAAERELDIILDVHNYGRYVFPGEGKYHGDIIGGGRVPYAAFADLWSKLAEAVRDEPAVHAYGLMNEPHDMEGAERWPLAAQAAIDAIRDVDYRTTILVPGDDWTAARNWRKGANEHLHEKVHDPFDNLVFEAHCYFDLDNSGTYKNSYEDEGGAPLCGADYVRPFVEWCREKGVRGFVGEYGVPDTDARWLVTMDRFLAYLNDNGVSSAYWAGGPWWGRDEMAIEPHTSGDGHVIDRPQMLVLRQYAG